MIVKQLRIGNFLSQPTNLNGLDYCSITLISRLKVRTESGTLKGVIYNIPEKFIPITEEWLRRFGYNKNGEYFEDKEEETQLYKSEVNPLSWFFSFGFSELDGTTRWVFINDINYIHELQNLYFFIQGVELTLINE